MKLWDSVNYFLNLTLNEDVLWMVFPLLIATVVMLFYFEKYKDERPGWNTYVANSLVLLFVSVLLFRYVYHIEDFGIENFIIYLDKFIVSFGVLLMGILLLSLNFKHFLPEKMAGMISSPLTLNLIAYVVILYVYSDIENNWIVFVSLVLLFFFLLIIFSLIGFILRKIFMYISEMKKKEELELIKQVKKPIEEKKRVLKDVEKVVRKEKRKVQREEKQVVGDMVKKFDTQKKEAVKLKGVAKK